jgi:hypothetical protein
MQRMSKMKLFWWAWQMRMRSRGGTFFRPEPIRSIWIQLDGGWVIALDAKKCRKLFVIPDS